MVWPEQCPLPGLGLLDLDDELCRVEYVLGRRDDACTSRNVRIVGCVDTESGLRFDEDLVPCAREFS